MGVAPQKRLAHQLLMIQAGVRWFLSWPSGLGMLLIESFGQQIVVDNRPGAGGTIGARIVADATPDGYTLLAISSAHTIAPFVRRIAYDPIKSFAGITRTYNAPYVLVSPLSLRANSVKDLVALAKAKPGTLNFASAGTGSATHLSMAYFTSLAGIEMVHIPFKATNEAIQEVMVGRAHAVMASTIGALPFARDSRFRMLGVSGSARSKFAPDLPTVAEAGLPGYQFDSWIGLLAPAGVPKATVEQMNRAVGDLLRDPAILERLAKQGVTPQALSPEAFGKLLEADFARMGGVVKAAGARID